MQAFLRFPLPCVGLAAKLTCLVPGGTRGSRMPLRCRLGALVGLEDLLMLQGGAETLRVLDVSLDPTRRQTLGAGALIGLRPCGVRLVSRRRQCLGLGQSSTPALSQIGGALAEGGLQVGTDFAQLVAHRLKIGMLRVDRLPKCVASCAVVEDFPQRHRAGEETLAPLRPDKLPFARLRQRHGHLVLAARRLDGRGGAQNPSLPALRLGSLGGGLVPGCLFGELAGPIRCVLAMLGQSRFQARGLANPACDIRVRRLELTSDCDERGEPVLKLAHRISPAFELRQVREPADMLGDNRPYRAGLRVGHGHREELAHELRLAPEIQEILDAALAAVEIDLGREQRRIDLLLGELALPILVSVEILEVSGVAGAHLVEPALHVAMSVQPAVIAEAIEAGRGDVVEGQARRASKGEEAPVELPLPALAARHDDLTGDEAPRLQEASLTAGEIPLDQDEGRYVSEVVAESLVGADQRLQEPPLVGVEATQHERQKRGLAAGVLEAEQGVPGDPGPRVSKIDRGARVVRLMPPAVGKMDARDVAHLPVPGAEESG